MQRLEEVLHHLLLSERRGEEARGNETAENTEKEKQIRGVISEERRTERAETLTTEGRQLFLSSFKDGKQIQKV